ncbi:hypothetical protein [Agromyces aureus]|uniref:TfoX N-terminal domain-containing protein n=1 Tax=Agromyces aureus TaxID=453304 RepID=A0A191WD98_9MICO|nr:hypothetical protein [Agromyces aureus]ANJ26154.1 hypothetical protein ATC03_04825 [Agromyces aureus]
MHDRERGLERLHEVTADARARADVAVGRMFGSEGYSVRSKLFAFVSTDGTLVVKLPEARIEELRLDNMVMRGSPMREWATVPYGAGADDWATIVADALAFVDEITP